MINKSGNNLTGMNSPDFLVERIPNLMHGVDAIPRAAAWPAMLAAMLISTAAGSLCWWAAGVSLGLFLGGLVVTGLLTAPMISAETSWRGSLAATLGLVHGVAGVWLVAMLQEHMDLASWFPCYLTLVGWVVGLAGLTLLINRFVGAGPVGSAAIVTLLAIAWLSWPLWLTSWLHGERGNHVLAWLIPIHPLFAVNAVLREHFGVWAEQGIAYNLTSLGDDLFYTFPENVYRCALVNTGIGIVGFLSLFRPPSRSSLT